MVHAVPFSYIGTYNSLLAEINHRPQMVHFNSESIENYIDHAHAYNLGVLRRVRKYEDFTIWLQGKMKSLRVGHIFNLPVTLTDGGTTNCEFMVGPMDFEFQVPCIIGRATLIRNHVVHKFLKGHSVLVFKKASAEIKQTVISGRCTLNAFHAKSTVSTPYEVVGTGFCRFHTTKKAIRRLSSVFPRAQRNIKRVKIQMEKDIFTGVTNGYAQDFYSYGFIVGRTFLKKYCAMIDHSRNILYLKTKENHIKLR